PSPLPCGPTSPRSAGGRAAFGESGLHWGFFLCSPSPSRGGGRGEGFCLVVPGPGLVAPRPSTTPRQAACAAPADRVPRPGGVLVANGGCLRGQGCDRSRQDGRQVFSRRPPRERIRQDDLPRSQLLAEGH